VVFHNTSWSEYYNNLIFRLPDFSIDVILIRKEHEWQNKISINMKLLYLISSDGECLDIKSLRFDGGEAVVDKKKSEINT
jgi:hypothetical protein